MESKKTINIPKEIGEYLWTRYLPETTYKMYLMVGYLMEEKIKGDKATKTLLSLDLKIENNIPKIIEEKKKVLDKLGFKYPENRKEDLELLLNFKLIKIIKDDKGEVGYVYNLPVPKPTEVLALDEEEKETLENIKFELQHQEAMNMIITLLLNNNGNLWATVEHIQNTTRVKIADIRKVLDFLVKEGSIAVSCNKEIDKLKKKDNININIIEDVFKEKRVVLGA